MAGPRLPVDAPAITTRPFGLLSVVNLPSVSTPHWQNGVTWNAPCITLNANATTYDECVAVTGAGEVPEPSVKADNVDDLHRGATPFTVYTRFDCAPVGNADALEVARDVLDRREAWQLERAFWTGLADGDVVVFPHLAASAEVLDPQSIILQTAATQLNGGAADDVATQLGRLESALAECYGGVGVIHVPLTALATLDSWGLVQRVGARDAITGQFGPRLQTRAGNLVAVGAGYPGTSPTGAAAPAGQSWLYATGAVFAYRGNVRFTTLRDSIDRETNTIEAIAERTYVIGWDCCHLAALVTLGVST